VLCAKHFFLSLYLKVLLNWGLMNLFFFFLILGGPCLIGVFCFCVGGLKRWPNSLKDWAGPDSRDNATTAWNLFPICASRAEMKKCAGGRSNNNDLFYYCSAKLVLA
jgi:hypothetical protein